MSKNILVTGANGQLGQELQELLKIDSSHLPDANFYFADKESLDITNKQDTQKYIELYHIDTIINCAAYTAVDRAEDDGEQAKKINTEAVKFLAEISKERKIWLIHISTDYVFDGTNYRPYLESDPVSPQGIYGKTKLAGEQEIIKADPNGAIIIRTSWLYSSFGNNFVKTMLRLGAERDELGIIYDQVGTPTYARDLASVILSILSKGFTDNSSTALYHYSNEGCCSWYDFAKAIFELSYVKCEVNPITTSQYPTLAKRPHYSIFNKEKIKQAYSLEIPQWRESLAICLKNLEKPSGL